MARDLYSVLGVARDADEDTIKKAYRKLAMKLHPDKNPAKNSEQKFKDVNRANDVLSDKEKRALYDEFGEESLSQGFDADQARAFRQYGSASSGRRGSRARSAAVDDAFRAQGVDFGDLISEMFGGQTRSRGGSRRMRGEDVDASVTIDFASAVKGATLEVVPPDSTKSVIVRIPAGADEGSRVRVAGQGGKGSGGGSAGDLVLIIHVTPHPFFKREGNDLHLDVPVSVGEAYRGARIRIPTPDGNVAMKIPARAQSGQVTRLRGKGVARKGKTAGDLYIRFLVQIPTRDGADIEKAVDILEGKMEPLREDLAF